MTFHRLKVAFLYIFSAIIPMITGLVAEKFGHTQRVSVAMLFLLEVLAVASVGRAGAALLASVAATLTYSYDFLPPLGSFAVNEPENVAALTALVITAITGSQLSIRAQNRAAEANRRRDEMEKLQRFSSSLLSSNTLAETAATIAREAVLQLGFDRVEVILRMDASTAALHYSYGAPSLNNGVLITLDSEMPGELYLQAPLLSNEFQRAFSNVVSLILDRANSLEERVRLESERRSDELHGTVLNALAHNFRTPLTSIKMASSTMLRLRGETETFFDGHERDLIQVIDEEADRLQALIRESLEFARLETHRLHPKTESCKVEDIVQSACDKVSHYIPPQRFTFSFHKDLPCLQGDRLLFQQMLFQVLDNAWKYSSPSAKIWVSATVEWTYLILTVVNEGPQLAEQDRERIFERFVRGSATRNKVEGTGLGLAIARTIAQSYGGKLWLEHDPRGPAFRFAFPIENGDRNSD